MWMNVLVVLLLVAIAILCLRILAYRNQLSNHLYLSSRFHPHRDLGRYEEANPVLFLGNDHVKVEHAVLILHGYSASPHDFRYVRPELEAHNIPYFCPVLTGFGLTDLQLLSHVRVDDWLRDVLDAYDVLQASATTVSVVGHSMGACLATYVAQHRPVKHLILLGPSFSASQSDGVRKGILNVAGVLPILKRVFPIVKKPVRPGRVSNADILDPIAALHAFHYPAVPVASLKELWAIQDGVRVEDIPRGQDLWCLYGEHDAMINVEQVESSLKARHPSHHTVVFPRSAHNILEDYDREAASREIVRILLS